MELIPILSTIILVATICTFLLAIGAYILYKVREAKGEQTYTPREAEVRGELITPVSAPQQERVPVFGERSYGYASQRQPIFVTQEKQASQPRFTPQPQQYNAERSNQGVSGDNQVKSTGSKFMKYTTEGYVTPQEDNKNAGVLKWR